MESFERINSIRVTNGKFNSCNPCKRLVPSRLHELHDSKFLFVSHIEFIRSKLSNFSAHVYVETHGSVLWPSDGRIESLADSTKTPRKTLTAQQISARAVSSHQRRLALLHGNTSALGFYDKSYTYYIVYQLHNRRSILPSNSDGGCSVV